MNGKRVQPFMPVLALLVAGLATGCATSSNQVLKYQTPTMRSENLIPGVEPEETARRIRISVTGKGVAPMNGTPMQKRMMAERAAVIDGYRQISERLAGAIVEVYTESGNNTITKDRITSETNAHLRGARLVDAQYEDGLATARVDVYITPRQMRFYHSSALTRAIMGALAGGTIGAVTGGAAGVLTNSTDEVIYETMGAAAATGALGGGFAGIQ